MNDGITITIHYVSDSRSSFYKVTWTEPMSGGGSIRHEKYITPAEMEALRQALLR